MQSDFEVLSSRLDSIQSELYSVAGRVDDLENDFEYESIKVELEGLVSEVREMIQDLKAQMKRSALREDSIDELLKREGLPW